MKHAALAALVLLTAACGAYHFPPSSPSGSGWVTGRVTAMPCRPVQPAEGICAGLPVPDVEIDFTSGGTTSSAVTDSTGAYTIELGAGAYGVKLKTSLRVISGPSTVEVTAGSKVVANYIVDTGIRVPVPQQ